MAIHVVLVPFEVKKYRFEPIFVVSFFPFQKIIFVRFKRNSRTLHRAAAPVNQTTSKRAERGPDASRH
jgi:hypothetical protein